MSTNSHPLVSVVIPVFNAELYIEEAINSILNQTYKNLEVIVVDDCSTDNSYEIVQKFNDTRIILLKNKINSKISKTLNTAISIARGDFIARMDADDISLPTRIEKQVSFLKENPSVDFCGSFIKVFGAKTTQPFYKTKLKDIKDNILTGSPFAHPSVMFRANLEGNLYYKHEFATAEDLELFSRLLKKGYIGTNIPEVLLYYRVSGNQTIYHKDINNNIIKNKDQELLSYKVRLNNLKYAYPKDFDYNKLEEQEKLLLTKKPTTTIKDLNDLAGFLIKLDNERSKSFYSKKAFINIFYYKVLVFLKLNFKKHLFLILLNPKILFLLLKRLI